jgi:DNA-binding transcriptional LysR family regulator
MMFAMGMKTFLAVVHSGSLSTAARVLNVAQTSVSKRLKTLEDEMGMLLIERGKGQRALRLTPAGETFYKLAQQWSMLSREADLLKAQGPRLSLVIGAVDSVNVFMLTGVYRALHVDHPLLKIEVRTLHSQEMYAMVEQRQVDIAFTLLNQLHHNVQVTPFLSTPMVVLSLAPAAPARGRHRANNTVDPADLDPQRELYIRWSDAFERWHDALWDPLAPSRMGLDSGHMLLSLLQDPEQWAIVPLWIADAACKRGHYLVRQLTSRPPDYVCYQLTHQQMTPSASQALTLFAPYIAALAGATGA